jgi:hypothetical protein
MFEPVLTRELNGGTQDIYRFDNGYGASVIDSYMSYGTELAVLTFDTEDNLKFELNYDTGITGDVIPDIDGSAELNSILEQIQALPARS